MVKIKLVGKKEEKMKCTECGITLSNSEFELQPFPHPQDPEKVVCGYCWKELADDDGKGE